jgi:hypothetical protein
MRARVLPLFLLLSLAPAASAQTFTKIVDPANPIVSDPAALTGYPGAAWIDLDSDGLPDLWAGAMGLYHNKGGGVFDKPPLAQLPAAARQLGCSWADYDNDGDPDLFLAGAGNPGPGSVLWRNDSPPGTADGPFTQVLLGATADSTTIGGWAAAWGDYDNDGRADLVVAGLAGFSVGSNSNHLLHNEGDGTLARDTSTEVDDAAAPFTVPAWSDFDQDGDVDLFIGAGPANGFLGPDFCFRNGTVGAPQATRLDRLLGSPWTDNRDGQLWNWIDYDNDGDLDVYVTNYGGGAPGRADDLYRNDGGTLVKQTLATVGPIASDVALHLASVWGDLDDDGDLDCVVTTDGGGRRRYYRNDVDSTGKFTVVNLGTGTTGFTGEAGGFRGITLGDYDVDGRLDVFVAPPLKSLWRNVTANGCHWVEFRLVGTNSNRSALGARIRVRAIIKGQPRWQLRELSAQNSFNGQNDLVAHFGLRESQTIDTVRIEWPSGLVEEAAGGAADRVYTIVEGMLGPTPTRLAFASARALDGGGVRLTFAGAIDPGVRANVERSDDGASWSALGTLTGSTGDVWIYDDATAAPGRRYAYRLAFSDGTAGELAWVDVPGVAFGFAALPANPCRIGQAARFTLTGAARFELVSANGRVVFRQDATAGSVTAPTAGLAPGLYWARAVRGDRSAVRRLVLVR